MWETDREKVEERKRGGKRQRKSPGAKGEKKTRDSAKYREKEREKETKGERMRERERERETD